MNVIDVIFLFLFYSIFGYFYEILVILFFEKKIEYKRGYLFGPYIPVYGFGIIFITLFLSGLKDNSILLFFSSLILAGGLEYFTSYLMEVIYGYRWWDYSSDKFNINGRITLRILVLFGLGGVLIVNFLNPFILNIVNSLDDYTVLLSTYILFLIFIIDFIFSAIISFKIKDIVLLRAAKDSTQLIKEETTIYIKNLIETIKKSKS